MRKKILLLLTVFLSTTALLSGCVKEKDTELHENNQQVSMDNKLLDYSENGMKILQANYPIKKDMDFALKNIGNEIPDLTLNKLDGGKLSLKKFKGKNVILEILQPNCPYCIETTPILHKVLSKANDIELIPIFIKADKELVESYYKEIGVEVHSNTTIDTNDITISKFGLTQTPSLIYVDSNGKISFVRQSTIDKQTFKDDLEKAFKGDKIYDMLKE